MKSIIVHVRHDDAMPSRFQVALDLARAQDAHLTLLQATPLSAYVAFDPMGGVFADTQLIETLRAKSAEQRQAMEAAMAKEDVRWDWADVDGDAVQALAAWSALADLLVISQSSRERTADRPLPLADDLVIDSGCPVLVVPPGVTALDATKPVVVAWNGSAEAAHAVRQSLPILRHAAAVHVVSIGHSDADMPELAPSAYLSRHGVASEVHHLSGDGRPVGDVLVGFAQSHAASMIVMGAYGRSRLRETLLGGATRSLLATSPLPLMLTH